MKVRKSNISQLSLPDGLPIDAVNSLLNNGWGDFIDAKTGNSNQGFDYSLGNQLPTNGYYK
ncbi:MAG: hypothetical protein AAFU03_13680 [Bacteroidota bacterium]